MLIFIGAFAVAYGLGFPVCGWLVRSQIIDRPNERSSHDRPIARGGGLAIMGAIALGTVVLWFQHGDARLVLIVATTLALAVVSFIDDVKSLSARFRFLCHAFGAVVVLALLGWPLAGLEIGPGYSWTMPQGQGLAVLFVWIAGYTNAFNFMDGINGIAAGQAVLTGTGMAILGGLASGQWNQPAIGLGLLVAGAAGGFLPHNFPSARMFMGDVGSVPLGFLLATLALWLAQSCGMWLLVPLALLHGNYVLDTGITLVRRMRRGEPFYKAHHEYFYQRLARGGKSHAFVTGCEMGLQCLVLLLMILYIHSGIRERIGLAVGVVMLWIAFFIYCEWRFQRSAKLGHRE